MSYSFAVEELTAGTSTTHQQYARKSEKIWNVEAMGSSLASLSNCKFDDLDLSAIARGSLI